MLISARADGLLLHKLSRRRDAAQLLRLKKCRIFKKCQLIERPMPKNEPHRRYIDVWLAVIKARL